MRARLAALMRRPVWPTGKRRSEGPKRDYVAEELRRRRSRDGYVMDDEPGDPEQSASRVALAETNHRGAPHVALQGGGTTPSELVAGIEPAVLKLLTPQLAHEFGVLPVRVDGSAIVFAVAEPPTFKLQNELRWLVGLGSERARRPVFVRIEPTLLAQCLDIYYPYQSASLVPHPSELEPLFATTSSAQAQGNVLVPPTGVSSVRSLVDTILMKAVYRGANDILLECFETEFRVRFKVEGKCEYAMTPLPPNAAGQIVSIVKQHARLDIAETERSQDGRFDMKIEFKGAIRSIQFRVATRPTINGESCVIRLHDNSERRPRLASVGADPRTLAALEHVRDHRGGLVLFSGPTGSGKTTTLAAILGECDSVRENIVTIEDPVEIRLPGITQSAVNELKGETFSRLLRNTLRVAPDRILVGEIRDAETAHLVIKASLTGHQVLSTVHADDAPRSVSRLLEEGASPFNLASVLSIVVAQRLLNRLCEHCAEDVVYPADVLAREQFHPSEFADLRTRESRGCSMCHHRGTFGRIAIFETLVVTDDVRTLIARRPFDMESAVRLEAIRTGMRPLRRGGLDLVRKGVVGLQQVADVTPYVPAEALQLIRARDGAPAAGSRTPAASQSPVGSQATTDKSDTLDVIRALIENARRDADAGLPVFSTTTE